MAYYLGIDLGTTGLKAAVIDADGAVHGTGYQTYPIQTPQEGYAQQDPEDWWQALRTALRQALAGSRAAPADIRGIGLSGQMHGSVFLGRDLRPLGPAVIWCDQRSADDLARIRSQVSDEELSQWVQNPVAAGFQVCTLLWLRRTHPALYSQVRYLLLPKDYIRLRLTGQIGTEPSDACGTLLFDCVRRDWSEPLLQRLDIDRSILPDPGHSACEAAGTLCPQAAAELGLRPETIVAFGGGDQPMQALGNGIAAPGSTLLTLGTGGQVFIPSAVPRPDPALRSHMFCHAGEGVWYSLGAILNCCLAQNWFFSRVLEDSRYEALHQLAAQVPPGSDGLIFLPYLTGERTPHMDPRAKGVFCGLTMRHDRAAMVRAAVEGISYALLDAYESIAGPDASRLIVTGGGARSPLWRQILADMFGQPIYTTDSKEAACLGAALCAAVACGAYDSLDQACRRVVHICGGPTLPDPKNRDLYRQGHALFQAVYRANAPLFAGGASVP